MRNFVEYVKTDGDGGTSGEYVLLDYTPTSDSVVEFVFKMNILRNACFFCARGASAEVDTFTCFYISTNGNGLRWDYNRTTAEYQALNDTTLCHTCLVSSAGLWLDGVQSQTIHVERQDYTPANKMTLFGSYTAAAGTPSPAANGNMANITLYRFRAWDDSGATLKVDLRPCVDTDGAIGLYDAVSKNIYYNLKSGKKFTAGPAVKGYADMLTVSAIPAELGEGLDPAYGWQLGVSTGDQIPCSAPAVTKDGAITATCAGYEVVADGEVVQAGTGNSFTYEHPENTGGVTLAWKWNIAVEPTGVTRTWTGAGADNLASTAENWSDSTLPASGDSVRFDGTSAKDVTWDAAMKSVFVYDWTQTADYTGTVTFETTYDQAFPLVQIGHDAVLDGGKWAHTKNSGTTKKYRLNVAVAGDLTIGANAAIDATGLGYTTMLPANLAEVKRLGMAFAGCHGGYGSCNNDGITEPMGLLYDSVTTPEDMGESGSSDLKGARTGDGGGAVKLTIGGKLTHNGVIEAKGKNTGYYNAPSGGSVLVTAGSIEGTGTISADGGTPTFAGAGGGGRIAVKLTDEGADFSDYDIVTLASAICGATNSRYVGRSGCGTIYAETAADTPDQGWLIMKGRGEKVGNKYRITHPFPDGATTARFSRITFANYGNLRVPEGCTLDVSDTTLETAEGSAADVCGILVNADGTLKTPSEFTPGCWLDFAGGTLDGLEKLTVAAGMGFVTSAASTVPGEVEVLSGGALQTKALLTVTGDLAVDEGATVTDDGGLSVGGDMTLDGAMTRSGPFTADPQPLSLTVAGDLTIGSAGSIDVSGMGYAKGLCPPNQTLTGTVGGSHGGRGGNPSTVLPYGSIVNPETAGSGSSFYAGGGIVLLSVGGVLTHNGVILARGVKPANSYWCPGAGGTINVTAGSLGGAGLISAAAGEFHKKPNGCQPGGGGRIAIRLTGATSDFSGFSGEISAYGSVWPDDMVHVGSAGTVWLSTAAQGDDCGTLRVENPRAGLDYYAETPIGGLVEGNTFGDVFVGASAKLQVEDGATLNVSGILSNGCAFVAKPTSTVRFSGTGLSRVYGSAYAFSDLVAEAPGKEVVFDDGATIAVSGAAALNGTAADNLTLRSATAGEAWTLTVPAGSAFTGVALRDCTSSAPITIVNGADLGGNSANVTFVNIEPGQLITWTGATDASWANGANWDRNRAPIATDKVEVPAGAVNQPVLATDATVAELTVAADASLSLGGKKLTVTGDAAIEGELICADADVLDVKGDLALASVVAVRSTVRLSGEEQALAFSGTTLYALEIASPAVTVAGDIACTSFAAGNGADAFDVAFAEGASLTANTMTVAGDPDEATGFLRCATDGGTWNLVCNDAHVSDVTVSGSDASRGVTIVPTDCTDGGDNVNWLFVDNRTHWTGAASSDFADPTNWSDGVPSAGKAAVVEGSVPCVISSAAAAGNFTVNPDAKVTVNADFTVNGSCSILAGATVAWNVPGEITDNLVLLTGATLTHDGNTNAEVNKLNIRVGGTGYVAAGAKVTADEKGYSTSAGPGTKSDNGGSHGGRGSPSGAACYGSIFCPTNLGSLANRNATDHFGGGAVRLSFAGALVVDGRISADGGRTTSLDGAGSGGSIWLTAASISGSASGIICAKAGKNTRSNPGGGGRIAIYLTEATSMDGFLGTVSADGTEHPETGMQKSAPGTYYLQTADDLPGAGTLLFAGKAAILSTDYSNAGSDLTPGEAGENDLSKTTVEIRDNAYAQLTRDARVEDIHITDGTGRLYLKGWTLRVHTRHHAISPNDATQVIPGTRIDPETGDEITGEIIWSNPGFMIFVR